MANVIRNSKLAAERAQDAADKAEAAAKRESFAAKRAVLLTGSYCVGADHYSGEFWTLDKRPPAILTGPTDHGTSSLHQLPNGDWMEVLGGVSWTRHTFDLHYALDRAKRAKIGGFALRADLVQAIVELVAVGANRMAIGALFQGISVDRPYMPTYSGTNNLYADEERASLIHYLVDECALIHPKHVDLIARVVALLGEPDTLRAYPSPVDPNLSLMISHLEEQIELFAEQGGLRAVRHP